MQLSDLPGKLPLPFAAAAGGGYIRPIPTASQIGIDDGAASLTDGFVPLNATPIGAGGVPPSIQDMNGILYAVSGWTRWAAAGAPVTYDAAFAALIGGYPKGSVLVTLANPALFWVSTADNNVTNPDTGGAGWTLMAPTAATNAEVATGTDVAKFVSPASLAAQRASVADLEAGSNVAKLVTALALAGLRASTLEITTGTDPASYITPAGLASIRATAGDVALGSDVAKYVTPAALAGLAGSVAYNGHYDLPGGFRIAWKHFTANSNSYTSWAWQEAFPTACFGAWANGGDTNNDVNGPYCSAYNAGGGTVLSKLGGAVACVVIGIGN